LRRHRYFEIKPCSIIVFAYLIKRNDRAHSASRDGHFERGDVLTMHAISSITLPPVYLYPTLLRGWLYSRLAHTCFYFSFDFSPWLHDVMR